MDRKKVSAGNLRSIGYDAATRTLEVELSGGVIMQYSGVSQETYRSLINTSSQWSYFRDNIEDDYPSKRVSYLPLR